MLALFALAVLPWLVSLALPVATTEDGRSSHGIFYLCFGWMQGSGGHPPWVWGWYGHIPALVSLVLVAFGTGSVRPIAARSALVVAFALAAVALAAAAGTAWNLAAVDVLGGRGDGQWTTPAHHFEMGFYVWVASFGALVFATLAATVASFFVVRPAPA